MGILLRLSLALSLLIAAVWFGGNLFWLWIVGVGLPSGDPDVALQAASAIETATGGVAFSTLAMVSVAALAGSAILSWQDQRGAATLLLGGSAVLQVVAILVVFALPVSAQSAAEWADYGLKAALASVLVVALSGATLTLVGLAIWSAARSRFVADV